MAAQERDPDEISSEDCPTPVMIQHFNLATEILRQCQEMTSENAPVPLQFNHRQCRYLVTKLETAVHSAQDIMESFSGSIRKLKRELGFEHGSEVLDRQSELWGLQSKVLDLEIRKFVGKSKYLVRSAMDVRSFIRDCCKDKHWIQAASILINAFEHISSLDSRLELCIWSFRNTWRIMLGSVLRRELISISEAQARRLSDLDNLLKKEARVSLKLENFPNLQGCELLIPLRKELEAALASCPATTVNQPVSLAELSVRDQVDLLEKVEQALSSGSISDAEERQMASSLAERFLVSVGDPFSDNTDIEFMRVDCQSLEREPEMLGEGGFAKVYKVKWLGIPAAEKVLHGQDLDEDECFQLVFDNLKKEVSMVARQSHPNIVRLLCYSMSEAPATNRMNCSMIQELMQKDLTRLIQDRLAAHESPGKYPFSVDEVVDILLQIAEGMDYLYRRRVLHRDLKSQNILVQCEKLKELDSEYILAKVADFGISRTKETTVTQSHMTWNTGTSRWMPPEVICINNKITGYKIGDWNLDWNHFKCDVYSFGMVSYEILTGKMPFESDIEKDLKLKVLQDERPPLPPEYPFCLRGMIHKCWRGEPSERPSFTEICRELRFMKGALLLGWDL